MPEAERPRVVAITGTIGAGKSLVGKILADKGIPVIDSDQVVHELFATSSSLQKAIAERFSDGVLSRDGSIDRVKLGEIVFADSEARHDLELIVHPAVICEISRRIDQHRPQKLVAVLAPLLFEAGLARAYDEIWTVVASEEVIRQRLKERDHLSDREIDRRLASQLSQAEKAAGSDSIIDNSGTVDDTRHQVETLLALRPAG